MVGVGLEEVVPFVVRVCFVVQGVVDVELSVRFVSQVLLVRKVLFESRVEVGGIHERIASK